MNHDFDFETQFCRRCGSGAVWITAGWRSRECDGAPNIIAISHIIVQRRNRLYAEAAQRIIEQEGSA